MAKPKLIVGGGLVRDERNLWPTPASPVKMTKHFASLKRVELSLKGVVINVAAADDFGGTKIADLPNTNMLIAGWMIDAVATLSGSLVGTNLHVSLGSAAAAATPLATTAIDFLEAVTATGAAQTATIKGHSFDNASPALAFKDAAASLALYVNAAITTTPAATVTFTSGKVLMFYHDLEEVA